MLLPLELWLSLGAIAVAIASILLFIKATGGFRKTAEEETPEIPIDLSEVETRKLGMGDLEGARKELRMLSLKREILSMAIKRLFEAEDEGEITREERIRLSKDYEEELKRVNEEIKRAELIVTLHQLETLREDIKKRFDELLHQTQARIDVILRELKIERVKEKPKRPPVRRVRRRPKEEPPAEEEKPPEVGVEERLEELRREVLKELEELERLELE